MNDKSAFPFWDIDWLKNQHNTGMQSQWFPFEQWLATAHQSAPFDFISQFQNQANPLQTNEYWNFYRKLLQQTQSFHAFGKQFDAFLKMLHEANEDTDDWQKILNKYFDAMKAAVEASSFAEHSAYNISPFTSEIGQEYFGTMWMTPFVDKVLSVPGFGSDREAQGDAQKNIKLLYECQRVFGEFSSEMSNVVIEALEAMRLKILEMAEKGEKIGSLRQIYDLWVACSEGVYAKHVRTDHYAKLYGRLVNALLALKRHHGKIVDKRLAKLGLPTCQGINTVAKRVQEMKREQAGLIRRASALENDIATLKQSLETERRSSSTNQASPKKANKKRAGKKRAAKKIPKKVAKKSVKTSRGKKIVIDI